MGKYNFSAEFLETLNEISLLMGFTLEELQSQKRTKQIVAAREFLALFLLNRNFNLALVGKILNRNHATIINNRNNILHYLTYEAETISAYEEFEKRADFICLINNFRAIRIYDKRFKAMRILQGNEN